MIRFLIQRHEAGYCYQLRGPADEPLQVGDPLPAWESCWQHIHQVRFHALPERFERGGGGRAFWFVQRGDDGGIIGRSPDHPTAAARDYALILACRVALTAPFDYGPQPEAEAPSTKILHL